MGEIETKILVLSNVELIKVELQPSKDLESCEKAMLSIRSIGSNKKYLLKDELAGVVNAFVILHLD